MLELAQIFQTMPKKGHESFYIQSNAFHSSLENCQIFGPLLLENLWPKTLKIAQSGHTGYSQRSLFLPR